MNPVASVIIPVYNGERFIAEALDCILAQTVKDLEIIVVDDASNDQTAAIVQARQASLAPGRLIYLRNERNLERSVSRNRGAAAASGQYLFFLDYDDLWQNDYLARVLEMFSREHADVVYSFPRTFVDANRKLLRRSTKALPADPLALVYSSRVGYPSATAMRQTVFPGYVEGCILREDWELFLRMTLNGSTVRILDEDLVMMRAHGGRTSASPKFWRSTLIVCHDYRDKVPKAYRGRFLLHAGDVSMKFGDLAGGWSLALAALTIDPSLLADPRVIIDLVKRGLRIDKYFRLAGERRRLLATKQDADNSGADNAP